MNMDVFHMDFRKFLVQVFTGSQCQRHLGTFLVIDTFLYTRKSKILGGKVQHTGGFRKGLSGACASGVSVESVEQAVTRRITAISSADKRLF